MRIALVFPRFTGPYGGERLVMNLAKGLISEGDEVTIFTHKFYADNQLSLNDVKIIQGYFPKFKNHQLSTFIDILLMPLLIQKIKNFDYVIGIGWQSAFALLLLLKTKKSFNTNNLIYYCMEPPRFVYDLNKDTLENTSTVKKPLLKLISYIIRRVDSVSVGSLIKIISISEWTSNQVKKIYNKNSKIIHPGVEVERFNRYSKVESGKLLEIPLDKKVYLSVSKLHIRKRLDLALKVFLEKSDNNSILYFIGNGPYKDDLKKLIEESDSKNIFLLGEKSDTEVTTFMSAADYFIFTAKDEPFGIAPLEAYVSGCEVIPDGIKYTPKTWSEVAQKFRMIFI